MYSLFLTDSNTTKLSLQNIVDFKSEKEVVIFETVNGDHKMIKGNIKEIFEDKILLEVDNSRISSNLAPLNF